MIRRLDRVGKLPPELVENTVDQAGDVLVDLEEATALRLELMAERSTFVEDTNNDFERCEANFCEHGRFLMHRSRTKIEGSKG